MKGWGKDNNSETRQHTEKKRGNKKKKNYKNREIRIDDLT